MSQGNEVVLVGRAELDGIYQSLKKMTDQATAGGDEIANFGKKTQDNLDRVTKKTENDIKKTGSALRRLASQLYSDFKGLMALESLQTGLKLSSQFKGAVSESIHLSDTIRRLGGSFGIAKGAFGAFQAKLERGLGDIGASSEAAAAALNGLTGKGVKGDASIMNLTKGAVTLAGMSGEKGNEGGVSNLLASTLQSSGKNVNDQGAQKALIGEVTAAVTSTGKKSSEILGAMDQMFSTMDSQLRGKMGPQGMAQMAVMATTVGPMATKAIQQYLAKSPIQRMAMQAQGFNIMGKNGQIDMKALQSFIKNVKGRTGMDPRQSLQTAGFDEEAAEGLVRLGERADDVAQALDKLKGASRDNEAAFKNSMGMLDSFKGAINTIKGRIEEWTGGISQSITDLLQAQVGHVGGSAAVVAGGATLAAILAGGGLRGIGKGLFSAAGGMAKAKAIEGITGEKVQNVYVVNAAEIAGGSAAAGLIPGGGKLAGLLGKAGMVAGAGAAGYMLGDKVINPALDKFTQGTTKEGFEGNAVERLFSKLDMLLGGKLSGTDSKYMKVVVETTEPNLRAKSKVSRGTSN